jgi:hypothetical protein
VSQTGFGTVTGAIAAAAGQTLNIGTIALLPISAGATTGTVKGVVSSAGTGAPIAGATVTANTFSVTTGSDGSYEIANVPSGAVTVSAAAPGYQTVTGAGSVPAGGILLFSPQLARGGGGTVTISGTASYTDDGVNYSPAAYAVVKAGTLSATADVSGNYTLANVPAGQINLLATYSSYPPLNVNFTAQASQQVRFDPRFVSSTIPNQNTLTVIVTDQVTGSPIAGASVSLNGLVLNTAANGESVFTSNVFIGNNSVVVLAAGYEPRRITLPVQGAQAVTLPVMLAKAGSGGDRTQTYIVPAGVYALDVTLSGGGGGGGGWDTAAGGAGGAGATVTATVAVTPGQVITVVQGEAGGFGTEVFCQNPSTGGTAGTGDGAGGQGGMEVNCPGFLGTGASGEGGGGGGASSVTVGGTVIRAGGGGGGGGGSHKRAGSNGSDAPLIITQTADCQIAGAGGDGQVNVPSFVSGRIIDGGGGGGGGGSYAGGQGAGGVYGIDQSQASTGGGGGASCYYASAANPILGTPVIAAGPAGGAGAVPSPFTPATDGTAGSVTLTPVGVQSITCATDPASAFNTATDGHSGILAGGATDLHWQVSNPGIPNSALSAGDYSAVPDSNWVPAVAVYMPYASWLRPNLGNAAWISQVPNGYQIPAVDADIFYRLQFILDSSVNLAAFQLNMDFWADNSVYEVWVNDMAQSGLPGVGTLPQTPSDPYYAFNYTTSAALTTYTFNQGWKTGLNTLIVNVKTGPYGVGFLAQFRGNQTCQPFSAIQMDVATDKPDYLASATALVTTTLTNPNPYPVSGALTVDVVDASGVLVGNVTQQGVSIAPGGNLPVSGLFPIGAILPAQYTVTAVLANNGAEMARASATFNVLPNNQSAPATSTVATDRYTYNPSDRVTISSRVLSQSANLILNNLTLAVQVVDAGAAVQFTHDYPIAQLLPGGQLDFSVQQPLLNAPAGIYTVKQDLLDEQQRVVSHAETAYQVGSTRGTGFGLTGTVAATPHAVHPGETLALAAAATNRGNADLANLPLTLYLIDPDLGRVAAQFTQTSTVATGASVPFDTTWITQGQAGATYFAVLAAQIDSHTEVTLAQDSFQIVAASATTAPEPIPALGAPALALMGLLMALAASRTRRRTTTPNTQTTR